MNLQNVLVFRDVNQAVVIPNLERSKTFICCLEGEYWFHEISEMSDGEVRELEKTHAVYSLESYREYLQQRIDGYSEMMSEAACREELEHDLFCRAGHVYVLGGVEEALGIVYAPISNPTPPPQPLKTVENPFDGDAATFEINDEDLPF